jgi:hypothetical protein
MGNILWGIVVFLLIGPAVVLNAPTTAAAQAELRLEQLQIDLWPEHDRPEMLIIFRGTLSADAPLPASVTIRVPARVGEPSAVAYNDGSGDLLLATYSTSTTDDWLAVTLETPERDFQMEFYDGLVRAGDERSYTLTWSGDYAVDELSYILLPPSGASEIETQPELLPSQQGTDSTLYGTSVGGLPAGQESQVSVSYRGGAGVSTESLSLATGEQDKSGALIAGIAVAGLALVIGGVIWYTRRTKSQPAQLPQDQRRRKRSGRRVSKTQPAKDETSAAAFCTKCGRPMGVDDRFCANCGTPVHGNSK